MNLPPKIKSIADIPEDFKAPPLGLRSEIITKISAIYPECSFKDPSWGVLTLPECIIELNLGEDGPVDCLALHVRGDERAPDVVAHILSELGMRAVDPSSDSGIFEQDR